MTLRDTWRMGSPRRALRACCGLVAIAACAVAATPATARAGHGGYPYWSYDGPGTDPASYAWTDAAGNPYSPYGYAYRNCTDFAAWKLSSANLFGDYRGLGNASSWAAAARTRGYRVDRTPAPGAVAWWGSELFGGFGHVAWVEDVYAGSVELEEYNAQGNGSFDRRRVRTAAPDAYIHFRDLPVRLRPGDFLALPGARRAYRLVGGAPVAVGHWSSFGGRRPALLVGRAVFDRLRPYPVNGTVVTAAGHPYRFAGGAPIAIGSWARLGGRRPAVRIDAAALAHAGGPGPWSHVRRLPRDHTILRAGPGGPLYVTRGGAPRRLRSLPAGRTPVLVDPAAIEHAGDPGPWRFLRSP